MTDTFNICRRKFESWAIKEASYDLSKDNDGDYIKPDTWELYRGWQACWEDMEKKIEDMENSMMAMSDSLGVLANE